MDSSIMSELNHCSSKLATTHTVSSCDWLFLGRSFVRMVDVDGPSDSHKVTAALNVALCCCLKVKVTQMRHRMETFYSEMQANKLLHRPPY